MINLLPPSEKEIILLKYKERIVFILGVLVLFFLICFISVLFLIKIYIQAHIDSQKIALERLKKEIGQSEIQKLQEEISFANLTLKELDSFYQNKIYLTEILERISSALTERMSLTSLSAVFYQTEEDVGFKISLSGFAPTREALFKFKENLGRESDFEEIYFPPVNWVKSTDIDFYVTFNVARIK